MWDCLGRAQLSSLLGELGTDRVLELFLVRLEALRLSKLEQSATRGHAVYKHIFVVDLSGLNLGLLRRENREMFGRVAQVRRDARPRAD